MQWSDVWLLLSILLGGGQDPSGATLHTIIKTGDGINHAIFTYEEIASGLNRLSSGGYVREEAGVFFATEQSVVLFQKAKATSRSIYRSWDFMAEAIGAAQYSGRLPNPSNTLSYPGVAPEAVTAAANQWHEEAEEWIQESFRKNR